MGTIVLVLFALFVGYVIGYLRFNKKGKPTPTKKTGGGGSGDFDSIKEPPVK